MIKKYCLLDKNGKYLESFSDSEISDNEKKSCIFTSPPNINENKVAFWENDNWKIKRKKIKDDLYDDLLKQLNFDDIKNEVAINNSHYKKIKATYSDYRYDKEDNEFDLGEILDNKYEADLYELSN